MSVICRTCKSSRCGNHSACARRKQAAREQEQKFAEMWESIAIAGFIVQRSVQAGRIESFALTVLQMWLGIDQNFWLVRLRLAQFAEHARA